jgi:hypothetical protein
MTLEQEIIEKLNILRDNEDWVSDPEDAHQKADNLLCECLIGLGYSEVVKAYHAIKPKWYA